MASAYFDDEEQRRLEFDVERMRANLSRITDPEYAAKVRHQIVAAERNIARLDRDVGERRPVRFPLREDEAA